MVAVGEIASVTGIHVTADRVMMVMTPGYGCRRPAPVLVEHESVLLLLLPFQHVAQEADVLDGQTEDLVLAQLLLRRVSGHQFSQFRKRAAYVLLPPTFPAVAKCLTREHD